jgi:hypothetical protein
MMLEQVTHQERFIFGTREGNAEVGCGDKVVPVTSYDVLLDSTDLMPDAELSLAVSGPA